jgi:hypothetical protein
MIAGLVVGRFVRRDPDRLTPRKRLGDEVPPHFLADNRLVRDDGTSR